MTAAVGGKNRARSDEFGGRAAGETRCAGGEEAGEETKAEGPNVRHPWGCLRERLQQGGLGEANRCETGTEVEEMRITYHS